MTPLKSIFKVTVTINRIATAINLKEHKIHNLETLFEHEEHIELYGKKISYYCCYKLPFDLIKNYLT